jgi:formylglycine-generating enzyme
MLWVKEEVLVAQAAGSSRRLRICNGTVLGLVMVVSGSLGSASCSRRAEAPPALSREEPAVPVAEPGFAPTVPSTAAPPVTRPPGMVWIPGGEFSMGASDPRALDHGGHEPMTDARPVHRVFVDAFWMDATEVTNGQYARFVKATGYVTVAEKKPTREEFPTAPEENLVAGSVVFTPPPRAVSLDDHYQWWAYLPGANWRHPEGPGSSIAKRDRYPVVHVAYEDALAYATWAGKDLPTEAEWEFAARGGLSGKLYPWGDELKPGGQWSANVYQGQFPVEGQDRAEDGFGAIAPVRQFPANGYGLYDVAGNVWEWVSDWYRPDAYATIAAGGAVARNPKGPRDGFDPAEPGQPKRVHRGGSYLCTDQYCTRYMVGTRGKGEVRSGSNHLGFRCVKRIR